jgi:voltage-gated potassium channel Kch
MKILGEGIKQKLIEMNEYNSFKNEKMMSSPESIRPESKLILQNLDNKKNNILNSFNIDLNSNEEKVKSTLAQKPDFTFFSNRKIDIKQLEKNKSCNILNKLNIKKIEEGEKDIKNNDKEVSSNNINNNSKARIRIKELKYRKLIKIKLVYDSMDDYDIDEDISDLIINPETKFILFFDLLIIVFYLYTFYIITIDLARTKCFCPLDKKFTFNDIIFFLNDILYILDIIISFFRGYYNFEYKLIQRHSLIIKNYLTGDFLIDFLEALPIFSINKYICIYYYEYNYNNCYIYNMSSWYITLKLLSKLKVFKLMKILGKKKNQALDNFYDLISENYNIERTTKLLINSLIFFIIIHCFVCLHIFIGKNTYSNWLLSTNSQDESLSYIYVKSLYFLVTTLTTVGYGDITCQSIGETIFQIILLAVGTIFYSYIISTIGNFIKNDSHAKIKCENDLNLLENIRISYPNMPFKLYKNIKTYLLSKSTS